MWNWIYYNDKSKRIDMAIDPDMPNPNVDTFVECVFHFNHFVSN